MRSRAFLVMLVVAGIVSGCSGNDVLAPVTQPNSPTLISITVAGSLSLLSGQTSQMSATANYAKGTTQNITSQATWSSANPAVATVSATGLVTGVSAGIAEIRAAYQNVTGSLQMTVNKPTSFTLSGTVTETPPRTSTPVVGARVEILNGDNHGKYTLTDASGQYHLTNLVPGSFNVRASMSGYQNTTWPITVSSDQTLSFLLNPTPQQISETFAGSIGAGDPAGSCGSPCKTFAIAIHNTGALQATLSWGSAADAHLLLQLFDADANRVLAQSPLTPSDTSTSTSETVSVNITTAANYELRVVGWQITRATSFTVTTTHIN